MDISGIGRLLWIGVAVTVTSVVAVACGDSGSGSETNVQPASPSVSTEQGDPLEGRWAQNGVTCAERRAAVVDAGFTASEWTMVRKEIGDELCVAHDELAFQDGQIVAFSGGVVAWEGQYELTDDSIIASDAVDRFTLRYSLEEDTLTFEVLDLTLQNPNERQRTIGLVIWTAGLEAARYARVG
jgi:hypothetical protein